jgi:ribosomal protein L29
LQKAGSGLAALARQTLRAVAAWQNLAPTPKLAQAKKFIARITGRNAHP